MNIVLTVPYSKTHYTVPPLGLGYLATALRKLPVKVKILDCIKERIDVCAFEEQIRREKPDVVGFQFFSGDYDTVQKKLDVVKRVSSSTITMAGGAHPSAIPFETLNSLSTLDYAFRGEGEIGVPLLIKKLMGDSSVSLDGIPGLVWRNDSGEVEVNPPSFANDLDRFGFPSWDLMDPRAYRHAPQGVFLRSTPVAPISTSRGCPFSCTYCGGHLLTGKLIRKRSVEHVIREIEMLYYDYGIREIHIVDDNFTIFRHRVIAFCEALQEKNLKISFTFPNGVRLGTLDKGLLLTMKKAGCYSMIVGIESGVQRILDAMKKQLTLEEIREKVALINDVGIEVRGFFILGYPTETKEDILATISFAKSLNLSAAHFSNFLPLPGTEATETLLKEGKLKRIDWSKLFYYRVPYTPDGITADELKALQRRAYLSFYLRPKIILRLLSEIKSLYHVKAIVQRLVDYVFRR